MGLKLCITSWFYQILLYLPLEIKCAEVFLFLWIVELAGFYAPCSHPQVSNHLTLLSESLPSSSDEQSPTESTILGNRNKCPVPGTLYNTNTVESFTKLDKQSLLKAEANKVCMSFDCCFSNRIYLTKTVW